MWRGRGRARRTEIYASETRPGNRSNQATCEEEDWDSGIQTDNVVKSVSYIGTHTLVPAPPSCGVSQGHDDRNNSHGTNNTVTMASSYASCGPKEVQTQVSASSLRYGPPSDSDDSQDEDPGQWDFDDKPKKKPAAPEPMNNVSKELDVTDIARNNPNVSITWLESILSKKSNKGSKASSPQACPNNTQKLYTEMNIFSDDIKYESERWMERVQNTWTHAGNKSGQEMAQLLQQVYSSVRNPYMTALYIVESASDCKIPKSSTLSHQAARDFEKWTKQNREAHMLLEQGGEELKIYAFYVGTRYHMTSFELIVKAFKMAHANNQYFIPHIKPFIEQQRFKEACQCIAKLDLQDSFETREILFPLILQDKVNLVEAYVFRHTKQQIELLKLLDELCADDINLNKIADDSGVKDILYQKLDRKIISKLAIRLMKLYQLDQEVCPNIDRKRCMKGIRYLIYKFYIEESLSRDTWRELVKNAADHSPWIQEQLIDELLASHDEQEAAWFAQHYALPADKLPHQVLEAMQADQEMSHSGNTREAESENWDEELVTKPQYHHALQLPLSEVFFIDTRPAFIEAVEYVVQTADMVGVDSEWRPMFGQEAKKRVALLQMATRDRVYLFDTIKLNQELQEGDWAQLGDNIFLNPKIIKLGYGFESDLQMIAGTIPELKDPIVKAARMVELQKLHVHVRKNNKIFRCTQSFESTLPPNVLRSMKVDEKGLSDMVRICLGRPLDKSEQMSDWEKRPLRLAQTVYSALDAYVLIQLYDHILTRASEENLEANLEPKVTAKAEPHRTKMQKRQARVAERLENLSMDDSARTVQNPPRVRGPPISPAELAVVVDTMIQGVGRYLRSCGVDVRILTSNEDHDAAAEIALRENRVILTSGQPYLSLRSRVPEGMCYHLASGDKARKQALEVIDHFNVKVTENDIFSRCPTCNGDHYAYIAPEEMQRAWDRSVQLVQEGKRPAKFGQRRRANYFPERYSATRKNKECGILGTQAREEGFTYDHIDMENVTLSNGTPIRVHRFPREITNKVSLFFCCTTCGKVFWEGSHFADMQERFSEVLQGPQDELSKVK